MDMKGYIPPNFDLNKYLSKGVSQISYSDWMVNQSVRYETDVNYSDDPGYPFEDDILETIEVGLHEHVGENNGHVDFPPVSNLTVEMIKRQLGAEGLEQGKGEIDKHIADRYFQCYHPFVNFSYSDEVLIESFKIWLQSTREKYNPACILKKNASNYFGNLVTSRILPYIDVTQWNKLHHRIVPESIMFDIIFPCDVRNQAIIQTTKKNAEKFLRLETSYALNALLAKEDSIP